MSADHRTRDTTTTVDTLPLAVPAETPFVVGTGRIRNSHRRSTAILAAAAIIALGALIAGVLIISNASSNRSERDAPVPRPAPTTSASASMPFPSTSAAASAPPVAPPELNPTATASTVVVAPPPPAVTRRPDAGAIPPTAVPSAPKTNVRERLHDLFPRLFPNP